MVISSRQNPRIKSLIALAKRKERERLGLMVVEGFEEVMVALSSGVRPTEVYFCPDLMASTSQLDMLQHHGMAGAEQFELSRDVFERAAYRQGPDGWLVVCDAVQATIEHISLSKNPLIIACQSVEKPGNLGAMLRTADAAGADAVVAVDAKTDWSNPNIVRASKGAVFAVPVADTQSVDMLAWLKKHKVRIIAATPDTTTLFTDIDMQGPIAICVGSEKFGLDDFWLQNADHKVRIPMFGKVDSLNVATSAALLTYEAIRQRGRV